MIGTIQLHKKTQETSEFRFFLKNAVMHITR